MSATKAIFTARDPPPPKKKPQTKAKEDELRYVDQPDSSKQNLIIHLSINLFHLTETLLSLPGGGGGPTYCYDKSSRAIIPEVDPTCERLPRANIDCA